MMQSFYKPFCKLHKLHKPDKPDKPDKLQLRTHGPSHWKPLEKGGFFFTEGREGVGSTRFVKTETKPPSSGKTDEENEKEENEEKNDEHDENHDVFARLSVNGVREMKRQDQHVSGVHVLTSTLTRF